MPVSIGTRLGPHEIIAPIDVGGESATDIAVTMNLVVNWTDDLKQRVPVR